MSGFEAELRARDPDRWLSSRFVADAGERARLEALYLLDLEWAKAAAQPNSLAANIRLAWWTEALERFVAGGGADHPALVALGRDAAEAVQPTLIAALDAYADGQTDSGRRRVEGAAIRLLDPGSDLEHPSVRAFPAIAHRTLEPLYAAGRTPGEVEKRLRILWAVLTGRLKLPHPSTSSG